MVAVLHAARRLGATNARVLKYGDSGDVSGDKRLWWGTWRPQSGDRSGFGFGIRDSGFGLGTRIR